ncbi:MAG TPA: HIT domain-containing protein [Thermoanaerobaculia bacterium]|nr:HIT domain-containing protein [Thermoanaerobaculia bacterium]
MTTGNAVCSICALTEREIIAANDSAIAFFARDSIRKGHLVVAVREHRPTFSDVTDDEARGVIAMARRLAAAAAPILDLEKFYLAAVGDVDRHFHIHLLPKKASEPKLGPFIFSAEGWAGAAACGRDAGAESEIRHALDPKGKRRVHFDSNDIGSVVRASYASISFREGEEPDWIADAEAFLPDARLIRVSSEGVQVMDLEAFRSSYESLMQQTGWSSFTEEEVSCRIEELGVVAHVASDYIARHGEEIVGRGTNSVQLVRTEKGWKIASMAWERSVSKPA